jgi:hypothetical protein
VLVAQVGSGAEGEDEQGDEDDEEGVAVAVVDAPANLAGRLSVAREVTWVHFLNDMWPKITSEWDLQ